MTEPSRLLIPRKPPVPRTDWLAWSLQFALGAFVGGVASLHIGVRMTRFDFISLEEIHLVIAGLLLVGGAIASYYGDDTWTTRSALDPERPLQSEKCRRTSIAIGSVGAAIMARAVIHRLTAPGRTGGHFSTSAAEIILLSLGAVLAVQIISAIRTGAIGWLFPTLDREEAPFSFWIWTASASLTVIYLLIRLLL